MITKSDVYLKKPRLRNSANSKAVWHWEIQAEIDGIGMGALKNGIVFLTGRGLGSAGRFENLHIRTIGLSGTSPTQSPWCALH
jgi:hypothetical protein